MRTTHHRDGSDQKLSKQVEWQSRSASTDDRWGPTEPLVSLSKRATGTAVWDSVTALLHLKLPVSPLGLDGMQGIQLPVQASMTIEPQVANAQESPSREGKQLRFHFRSLTPTHFEPEGIVGQTATANPRLESDTRFT